MNNSKNRTTQIEKSQKTRNRLIEATLDCLQAYGYHGTSLAKILEKSGVSKGAWSHHYGNKTELIASAAEFMLKDAIENGKEALLTLLNIDPKDHLNTVLDYFWENFQQGKRRDVWVEVYIASRTDLDLRKLLVPVIKKFHSDLNVVWRRYFKMIDKNYSIEITMNLTLYLTRGMAIQSIIEDDPEYFKEVRAQWVKMMEPLIQVSIPE